MANSEDPDEMACYKPSHLDLHCLQNCLSVLVFTAEMLELIMNCYIVTLLKEV